MEEVWKQIPNCPRYEASSLGRIRGINPKSGKVTIRSQSVSSHGYLTVNVQYADGRRGSTTVHSLVCTAFHGDRPSEADCCHGVGGSLDNSSDNLRWDSRQENFNDQKRHGTFGWFGRRKLSREDVLDIVRRIDSGDRMGAIASDYKVAHGVISGINLGNYHSEITGRELKDAKPKREKQNRSLTKDMVIDIVSMLDAGELQSVIAIKYGVTPQNISDINTGKLWSWVTGRLRRAV